MKKNKLSVLTISELNKQKKSIIGILCATGIVMLILCCVLMYLIIKNHKITLISVVPICLLIMLPGAIRLSQINSEIKSRNSI